MVIQIGMSPPWTNQPITTIKPPTLYPTLSLSNPPSSLRLPKVMAMANAIGMSLRPQKEM